MSFCTFATLVAKHFVIDLLSLFTCSSPVVITEYQVQKVSSVNVASVKNMLLINSFKRSDVERKRWGVRWDSLLSEMKAAVGLYMCGGCSRPTFTNKLENVVTFMHNYDGNTTSMK